MNMSLAQSLLSAQRDAARRVAEARTFSVRLPLIGTVRVPPPDQLAFWGVLGGLALLELIDWPVALAMGVGSALVTRHLSEVADREADLAAAVKRQATAATPKKAPARKAPAKKAPAKKAPAKKAVRRRSE